MVNNLLANWPAPPSIQALTTTREKGHSLAPYDHNNLGLHVGDDPESVMANREALIQTLSLPSEPFWLEQTHSTRCMVVEGHADRCADAAVTRQKNIPLAIMTADCLPIVICDTQGQEIAAIHAGWRGLAEGIIDETLSQIKSPRETLMAWIGPAICGACYQVGPELKRAFSIAYPYTTSCFEHKEGHHYANLPLMAERILNAQGIDSVYQSHACTFELKNQFYSYRRQAQTGRMVTLIWIKDNPS